MRKTTNNVSGQHITVNLIQLKEMLGCGKQTARIIAEEAGALIRIGTRVLYSVPRIEQYIEELAMNEQKGPKA